MSVSLNTMKHIWLFNRIVATTYSLLRTYDTYGTFKGTAIRTMYIIRCAGGEKGVYYNLILHIV